MTNSNRVNGNQLFIALMLIFLTMIFVVMLIHGLAPLVAGFGLCAVSVAAAVFITLYKSNK